MKSAKNQQGFSLFMVMIIMLVIALLVVVTSQSSTTEMRISTNEADRKYALSLAENGLRDAENFIGSMPRTVSSGGSFNFTVDCQQGLCTPSEDVHVLASTTGYKVNTSGSNRSTHAWKREFNQQSVFDVSGRYRTSTAGDKVRYIVEFLGERSEGSRVKRYFRITSRAKGENPNTTVTLQIHVEMFN